MTSPEALAQLAKTALAEAGVDDAEIFLRAQRRGFARFGRNELDQHMDLDEPSVVVRAARGTRVAEVRTEALDHEGIVAALRDADERAASAPDDPSFPGFAPANGPMPELDRWSDATAQAGPETRTAIVAPILAAARDAKLFAAGGLETRAATYAVATTRGLLRTHRATAATLRVFATETAGAGGPSGFSWQLHRDVGRIDAAMVAERAIRDASLGKDPIALDVGAYDVVFEPPAFAELVEWLAMTAFGAKDVDQKTSIVAGRRGEAVFGERFTLAEDPLVAGDLGFGMPFDREGTLRRRVSLVERGVAKDVLYDRAWAKRHGTTSTGNATIGGWPDGPQASSLVMDGGEAASAQELVRDVERGIYVMKLHYVNGMLDPRRAVMTGLLRDGAFLVEKGAIVRGVRPLRFTESFADATKRIDGMTKERFAVPTWWSMEGTIVCPAVRVRGFTFTGSSG